MCLCGGGGGWLGVRCDTWTFHFATWLMLVRLLVLSLLLLPAHLPLQSRFPSINIFLSYLLLRRKESTGEKVVPEITTCHMKKIQQSACSRLKDQKLSVFPKVFFCLLYFCGVYVIDKPLIFRKVRSMTDTLSVFCYVIRQKYIHNKTEHIYKGIITWNISFPENQLK